MAVLCTCVCFSSSLCYAQTPILIRGQVTEAATGKPFADVRVSEFDSESRILGDVRTDANGKYMIRITPGNSLLFSSLVAEQRRDNLTEPDTIDIVLLKKKVVKKGTVVKGEHFSSDETHFFLLPLMGMQINRGGGYSETTNGSKSVLATGAMLSSSYGGMIGVVKNFGGYLKYRYAETEKTWFTMKESEIRAGVLYNMEQDFFLYGGVGVDLFSKESMSGSKTTEIWPALEGGLIYRWHFLAFTAGVGYVFSDHFFEGNMSGVDLGFDFGVGVAF